jgi:hypothetical protein
VKPGDLRSNRNVYRTLWTSMGRLQAKAVPG